MAGITAARELAKHADVTVFEKSRGFGGRMATRRSSDWQFDHGAQFFTARSDEFKSSLAKLETENLVAEWQPKVVTLEVGKKSFKREWFEPHFVATPSMSNLVRGMTVDLEVKLDTLVTDIREGERGWLLVDKDGHQFGEFDFVVSAIPAPQCLNLFPESFSYREQLESVYISPCFALMLGYSQSLNLNFDAAIVKNSPVGWLAADSTKPERQSKQALLVHSSNEWAASNLELPANEIQAELLESLKELLVNRYREPEHTSLHRWRFARADESLDGRALVDPQTNLAACGDWNMGNRVEDAYLSGLSTAQEVLDCLQNN